MNRLQKAITNFERKNQRFLMVSIGAIRFVLIITFWGLFGAFWLFMSWLVVMALWRIAFGGC